MYILYIDTHDKETTLIIYQDNKILKKMILTNYNHLSEVMIDTLDKLLKDSKLTIDNINEIWVINGPGSFTSIRIGVTIAKTLAYCLNIPIKTTTYLELLASQVVDTKKIMAMSEKNGFFIAKYHNDELENMFYLAKSEYLKYKQNNNVSEDLKIDYNKIPMHFSKLKYTNSFDVNPIYIKNIGALSDTKN